MKKRKRGKLKHFIIFIILLSSVYAFFKLYPNKFDFLNVNKIYTGYLASENTEIEVIDKNDNSKKKNLIRGRKVKYYENEVVLENGNKYIEIKYKKNHYLISKQNIADKYENSILEKIKYVRTNTTSYKNKNGLEIDGYLKKGTKLNIIGFDKLNSDGSVNKYRIDDKNSYVYSKYLVDKQEQADALSKNSLIHKDRTNTLGAGGAIDLDYYPVEKPDFKDNKLLKNAKTLYLNCEVLKNIDAYIDLAKKSGINSFVVDIKENTIPSYKADTMKEYSPTSYNKGIYSKEDYKKIIDKIKSNGLYVIGRITTFKDNDYIADHPESAINSTSTNSPYLHNGSYWPSAFVRDVWEYNVKLAVESVKDIGFNEIQFDYMRFPDRCYTIETQGLVDMKNIYNETKSQALQTFLMYASDAIHEVGAYISVDVFGESSNTYVTSYGQYWPAISNVVDVISAMPYPDHFEENQYGLKTPWTQPYTLLKAWSIEASTRQTEIETPAIARTWIQAYDAIKSPYNHYNANEIQDEIKGLTDGGLEGGFITWNGSSNIEKYKIISTGW